MSDLIGKIVSGRYRVDAFLGKGGMAEVYKVWDMERNVYLAMKILHADLAEDKVFLRRFKREAQTLQKLQHPNIVRFYGLEQDGDLVYMLIDYVEGTTLRKEIFQSKTPLAMERILEVMKSVCAALYYAHKSGFVHCDIKPANIMMHNNGNILVADFGIARMTEASTVTMVGAGTPAYMSPEQIKGEDPIPQMDIYALGIILFEMLAGGERPFTGENAKTTGSTSEKLRWEQLRMPAPPPSIYNKSISSEMDAIVLKCLDKTAANRYLSAMDLYGDLITVGIEPAQHKLVQQSVVEISASEPSKSSPTPEPSQPAQPPPISAPPLVKPQGNVIKPQNSKNTNKMLLGIGVVIVGLLCISMFILFISVGTRLSSASLISTATISSPTSTRKPTSIPSSTAILRPTSTPRPTATKIPPTSTPAPIGMPVKNRDYEVTVLSVRELKRVYMGSYYYYPPTGYLFIEMEVKVTNLNLGTKASVPWNNIQITSTEVNSEYRWGGFLPVETGKKVVVSGVGVNRLKDEKALVTFDKDVYLRLIWFLAKGNPTIVLFHFDNSPLIKVIIN